ncbi:MAG: hypothetical protein PWQ91_1008 [Eubacteriales bacterium]|nr:hypothetical protein [Eubacteriales bacterium]MDN5363947.1 hypothetical protein [Eubacteriales bacterium]
MFAFLTLRKKILASVCLAVFFFFSPFVGLEKGLAKTTFPSPTLILVVEGIDPDDLLAGKAPFLQKLARENAVGLMNVRSKPIFNPAHPEGSYLTAATGLRVVADPGVRVEVKGNAGRVIDYANIKEKAVAANALARPGLLGDLARRYARGAALISTREANNLPAAFLVADGRGEIPFLRIGLAEEKEVVSAVETALGRHGLVVVDAGKIPEGTERKQQIRRLDSLAARLYGLIERKGGRFIFLVSAPSQKARNKLNFQITPFVLADGKERGLLSSATTGRRGLVTSLDLLPTLFPGVSWEPGRVGGAPMTATPCADSLSYLTGFYRQILNLNLVRYLYHGLYIILAALFVFTLYRRRRNPREGFLLPFVGFWLLLVPGGTTVLFVLWPTLASLPQWWYYFILVTGFLALLSTGAAYLWRRQPEKTVIAILAVTVFVLLVQVFSRGEALLATPFGYNDLMIGGRFYGLNNDAMAFLLGSAVTLFYLSFGGKNPFYYPAALTLGGLLILAMQAPYGANVGGAITAATWTLLVLLPAKWRQRPLILAGAVVAAAFFLELAMAAVEVMAGVPTHAGKALLAVAEEGFTALTVILKSKLGQLLLMIILPPWNLLLALQLCLLFRWQKEAERERREERDYLLRVVLPVALTGLFFNDTGVTVAAVILGTFMVCLGLMTPPTAKTQSFLR